MQDRSGPGQTTAAPTTFFQGGGDKCDTGRTTTALKIATESVIIGTWNVRTLYACGKLAELEYELQTYRWNIRGLSEMRWTGLGEVNTEEGHKL